jgi:outer membrane protein assembly factor BamB
VRNRVNLAALYLVVVSCGPSPRPVPPLPPREDVRVQLPAAPRIIWRKDIGSGLLAPLQARGPALFATTTNRAVVALDVESGRRFWMQRFGGAISTGIGIDNGRLFFATADANGSAHALDPTRGKKIWSQRLGPSRAHPLLLEQRVIFGTETGWVYALDAARGTIAWRSRLSGAVIVPPIAHGQTILVATEADSVYSLDVATGSVRVRAHLPAAPSAAMHHRADTLVVPLQNGSIVALNPETLSIGRHWLVGEPVLAAPVEISGTIFVLNRGGEIWRLGAGEAERVIALGAAARGALSAADGRLIAGLLDGRVVAVDPAGTVVWEVQANRSVAAPPTAVGNAVFVPLLNGEVVKLQ